MASGSETDPSLSPVERQWMAQVREADGLADLVRITGAGSEHDAYFAAKRKWRDLRIRELGPVQPADGLPGDCIDIDDRRYCVHGVTHAGTAAERTFLREHVSRFLADGETVYCEQGIRPMYFSDFDEVCEMDDYRWAMARCRDLAVESHIESISGREFDGLHEEVKQFAAQFREATFSLIEAGRDVYGERYAKALGDVAAYFLTSHEDVATGTDFASFRLSQTAAEAPETLGELQNYYRGAFLPQPIEREWLRRHDPELEIVTHARNERMAAYALSQPTASSVVRLVVGAAHQPGVTYYLEQYRDGAGTLAGVDQID